MSRRAISQDYDDQGAGRGECDAGVKRARVSQACEQCRSRRSKCDGRRPTCAMCESQGQKCVYDPNPKKRGVPPGASSTLERRAVLLELLLACVSECGGSLEQLATDLLGPSDGITASSQLLDGRGTALLNKWRQSSTFELIQTLATDHLRLEPFWQSVAGYSKISTMPYNNDSGGLKEATSRKGK